VPQGAPWVIQYSHGARGIPARNAWPLSEFEEPGTVQEASELLPFNYALPLQPCQLQPSSYAQSRQDGWEENK
jgi:hypothetical protein